MEVHGTFSVNAHFLIDHLKLVAHVTLPIRQEEV
jgi:hypothetical protein